MPKHILAGSHAEFFLKTLGKVRTIGKAHFEHHLRNVPLPLQQ